MACIQHHDGAAMLAGATFAGIYDMWVTFTIANGFTEMAP